MRSQINRWLPSDLFPGDEEKSSRAYLLLVVITCISLFTLLGAVGLIFARFNPLPYLFFTALMIGTNVFTYRLVLSGKVHQAGYLVLAETFLFPTLFVINRGTVMAPVASLYIFCIIIAGALYQQRGIWLSTLATSLAIAVLIIAEANGLLPEQDTSLTATVWVTFTALFGLTGALSFAANDLTRKALQHSRQENAERQRAEEALRASENKFSKAFLSSPDSIILSAIEDGRYLEVNDSFLRDTGYQREEIIGFTSLERDIWASPAERERLVQALRLNGSVRNLEAQYRRKSGELRDALVSAEVIELETGRKHLLSVVRDITENKQANRLLQKSQASLETAQAIAHLGSWELEPRKGQGLMWSREMYELFNFDLAGGVPALPDFMARVHPDDRQSLLDAQQRAIDSGEIVQMEYRAYPQPAVLQYYRASIQAIKDPNGQVLHMSGTVQDITASRLMELALGERVKELTCIFHTSRLLENRQAPLETVCQGIVALLPPAMQFPHLTAAALTLDGSLYTCGAYAESLGCCLEAAIAVGVTLRGRLKVCYTSQAPFIIPEEQHLLDNLARMLGLWLEQREADLAVQAAQRQLEELNRDLEKRVEERTAEVRRSEATYRALFENASDGIFLISTDEQDLAANPQALKLLGYTPEEYQTMNQAQKNAVVVPEQRREAADRFQAVLRGEPVPLYERTMLAKDGRRVDVEINLSPVRDPSGKIIMVQSVVRDITERKRAEEALRESRDQLSAANAALEKASRLKDEFMASMSHELRTPLTGILGLAEALQLQTYGPLSEKQLQALKNIENSGRHLLDLINDILDLSKIEADKLDLQMEACVVAEICHASLQLTKGMAYQKRQMVSFSASPPDAVVQADPRRLKQMLVNLLSNAVKFTPEGGSLGLEVQGYEADQTIHLTVWDKGIGIKPEDLGLLFRPFTQLDSKLSRQHAGTGLGLSLVSRLAELHGGSVSVESVFGEGSRFTIILPWVVINQALPEPSPEVINRIRRCLLIEDNPLHRNQIAEYLHRLGIECIMYDHGRNALETAVLSAPDAILLDLNLPDISGDEVLSDLKRDPRTREIVVIISSVTEDRRKYLDMGAAGYLVKPFSADDLEKELLRVQARSEQAAPKIEPSARKATVLFADDDEVSLSTLTDFLSAQGYVVIRARSGKELVGLAPIVDADIILTDIQMPGMDGLQAIRLIRASDNPSLKSVPIVALTALAMPGDEQMCLAAGANRYISKPVALGKLASLVEELLSTP